jgi:two-component system sensor histidine kinase HydH
MAGNPTIGKELTGQSVPSSSSPESLDLGEAFQGWSSAGIVAVDASRKVAAFNRPAERLTGLESSQVLNQSLEILPPALKSMFVETFESGAGIDERPISLGKTSRNGASAKASSIVLRNQEGALQTVLVLLHDLSPVKRVEIGLRRLDRLAQTGVLAASAAHEIKNALVAIRTFIEVLLERNQESELSNLVSHEIQRIDSILSQLLKFTGPAAAVMAPLRLHEVLDTSLKLIQHKLGTHQIKLVRAFKAENDGIQGDEKQLRQAFINLFLNAIDAMRMKGTLQVSTELAASGVWSDKLSSKLLLKIKDSGKGIAPEDLPHLYEPFFTTKPDGTGLGLAITRRVIEEHGGTMEVESEVNRGTMFTISLPAR